MIRFFTPLLFLSLAFLTVVPGLAQTGLPPQPEQISWQGSEPLPSSTGGQTASVPTFLGAAMDYATGLPHYSIRIPAAQVSQFELVEATYAPFSEEEAKAFSEKQLPAEPQPQIYPAVQNKQQVHIVSFIPIRRNPQTGQPEKLTHFTYRYQTDGAPQTQDNTDKPNRGKAYRQYAQNSVLSTGDWYRIAVTASGIHKIDRALLQSIGVNPQATDPRRIMLFGNATGMLPQPNATPRPDDLVENAIFVAGEADGSFDASDYILFYAQGPHVWENPSSQNKFSHISNLYADTAYYFITVGAGPGKRIQTEPAPSGVGSVITSYDERWHHERDLKNLQKVGSGREWYGEEFSSFQLSRDFVFPASDLVPGTEVQLTSFVVGNSPVSNSFAVKLNGTDVGTHQIMGRGTRDYHAVGINSQHSFSRPLSSLNYSNEIKVNLTYNQGSSTTAVGYLNYLQVQAERALKLYGNQTNFRSLRSLNSPVSTFQIGAAPAGTVVWDVTNPRRPLQQTLTLTNGTASFTAATDSLREFVAFAGTTFPAPVPVPGKVANQNLHSLNLAGNLDLVILTHPLFKAEADRLAEHRRSHDQLVVEVVITQQVYNEFSSGAQDVTAIRDFMKMLYDRSKKSPTDPMYLLLFGDASFDYKNRVKDNTNFVPVYQSYQSLDPITSYSSEDYFGFLDEEEGMWSETSFMPPHLLDIGIGRLPAQTAAEAAVMVQKLIAYDQPVAFGEWRNKLTFVADDGDNNEHLKDAEYLCSYLETNAPSYNLNKAYLDLFRQESVPNGQRSPDTKTAIDKAVEQGSFIINYTGHGGVEGWAEEQILRIPQIRDWKNQDRLPFMLTATCEFGRYDDPERSSGAEQALLHPEGGVIGLLTTTRPVYSTGNRILNRDFFALVFKPVQNRMPRLGDLMQGTKNKSLSGVGVNNRNFALLGDPSQTLAYPQLQTRLDKVNGKEIGGGVADTLRALSRVTLEGSLLQPNNTVFTEFNGQVKITVFEKAATVQTLGNQNPVLPISLRENILYDGLATVQNGRWTSTFVIPKDIAYQFGRGKVSLYAFDLTIDAHGSSQDIVIGGVAGEANTDNTPPQISLFMDDESFVFGGITNPSTTLFAKLFDENGINTSGVGIGHEITGTLDGNKENILVLNDYYTAEKDDFQNGKVRYLFKDLATGPHTLLVKAWDTHNNSAEEQVEFIVANNETMSLMHVLNYPNPFSSTTTFHFDHNRSGDDLDILVQIFTVSGRLVKSINSSSFGSTTHIGDIVWDGKDDYNDLLAKGVYVYKVTVRSQRDGSTANQYEKLVILN